MLLNYTSEDQLNIGFSADSSSGKTYIPLELAAYFPAQDVMDVGYASPSAFFHEFGEWDEETNTKTLSLEKKILIFLDQPSDELLQRLRPLLSHDKRVLKIKITDRSKRGGHATKNVMLIGYPTVIFCSTRFSLDEQERTRLLQLSPETSDEKITAALQLLAERLSNRDAFRRQLEEDPRRQWLAARVEAVKSARIDQVTIDSKDSQRILDHFNGRHYFKIPRLTRDLPRLIALAKAHCLLNFAHRQRTDDDTTRSLQATADDVDAAIKLYEEIAEANELGLPPAVHEFYKKVLRPLDQGVTRRELATLYYSHYHRTIGERRLKALLTLLEAAGLVYEEPDPEDKRRMKIYATGGVTTQDYGPLDPYKKEVYPDGTLIRQTNLANNNDKAGSHTPRVIYSSKEART